jgi:hypothetical protein
MVEECALHVQGEIAAFKQAAPQFPITYQIWESSHSLTVRPCTLTFAMLNTLHSLGWSST